MIATMSPLSSLTVTDPDPGLPSRSVAVAVLVSPVVLLLTESVAGVGPVPTVLVSDLAPGERLPPATERAAYFVVS